MVGLAQHPKLPRHLKNSFVLVSLMLNLLLLLALLNLQVGSTCTCSWKCTCPSVSACWYHYHVWCIGAPLTTNANPTQDSAPLTTNANPTQDSAPLTTNANPTQDSASVTLCKWPNPGQQHQTYMQALTRPLQYTSTDSPHFYQDIGLLVTRQL